MFQFASFEICHLIFFVVNIRRIILLLALVYLYFKLRERKDYPVDVLNDVTCDIAIEMVGIHFTFPRETELLRSPFLTHV